MKDGVCPKCNSRSVYKGEEGKGVLLYEFHVYTGRLHMPTPYVSYVCTTCGYFEVYVTDQKVLAEVPNSKNWTKVD